MRWQLVVRDAMPQAHDWTLNERLQGLLTVHDTPNDGWNADRDAPDGEGVPGVARPIVDADADDLARMDRDMG